MRLFRMVYAKNARNAERTYGMRGTLMFKAGTPIRATMSNTRRVVVASNDTYTIVRSHDWSYARSIDNASLEKYWVEDKSKGRKKC